jgi:hypothetical protein
VLLGNCYLGRNFSVGQLLVVCWRADVQCVFGTVQVWPICQCMPQSEFVQALALSIHSPVLIWKCRYDHYVRAFWIQSSCLHEQSFLHIRPGLLLPQCLGAMQQLQFIRVCERYNAMFIVEYQRLLRCLLCWALWLWLRRQWVCGFGFNPYSRLFLHYRLDLEHLSAVMLIVRTYTRARFALAETTAAGRSTTPAVCIKVWVIDMHLWRVVISHCDFAGGPLNCSLIYSSYACNATNTCTYDHYARQCRAFGLNVR